MSRRVVPLAVLLSVALLGAAGAGIVAFLGTDGAVLGGVALGALLGAGGAAWEFSLLRRTLPRGHHAAFRVLMGGFAARVVVLFAGTLALHGTGLASGAAFALTFLAGFLAFLPVLAAVTLGGPRNGEARS